jgi:hypothetical protein
MSLFYGGCTRKRSGAWLLLHSFNPKPAFHDDSVHVFNLNAQQEQVPEDGIAPPISWLSLLPV